MNDSTSSFAKSNDDTHQKALEQLWGDSLKKLTPKQRQLVVDILKNMKKKEFGKVSIAPVECFYYC